MTRQRVDMLILDAAELVTLRDTSQAPVTGRRMGQIGLIQKGAVAIDRGTILDVGKTNRIARRYKSEHVVDASGKTVIPGFVDCHTHLVFGGSREEESELKIRGLSYLEILRAGGGILKTVRETRKSALGQLVENCLKTLDTMLHHGTTTVEAKTGYGLTTRDEAKCLEALRQADRKHPVEIAKTFLGAHAVPPRYQARPEKYVKLLTQHMIPSITRSGLAEFCDVFCEKGVFNVHQSRRILKAGLRYSLTPEVHADELARTGGAELAAEVGAASASHLVHASNRGLKMMAQKNVVAILLPCSSFALMSKKYPDARSMIEMGVPVALATDYNPNCLTENMQAVITLAAYSLQLTAAEAITAATINAAHAIKRNKRVGSIEPGKQADIVVLDAPNHRFLAYHLWVNLVDTVIKKGEIEHQRA
ncbi:MAG: imidazolonepropionase [Aigarchaeota archaeon]|nr:imidazolonepropionase [Aigarchaeota archaeon]